jgi:hypothetical protein
VSEHLILIKDLLTDVPIDFTSQGSDIKEIAKSLKQRQNPAVEKLVFLNLYPNLTIMTKRNYL